MTDLLILTAVKLLKMAILGTIALVTPPEGGLQASQVPGLEPCMHGAVFYVHETEILQPATLVVGEAQTPRVVLRQISL